MSSIRFLVALCFSAFATSLLMSNSVCVAQTSTSKTASTDSPKGFDWLKQFEGRWKAVSTSETKEGQPITTQTAIVSSRIMGNTWVVNEYAGTTSGMKFSAVQSLGYNSNKKQFKGQWIDSFMNYTWRYSGSLDESGIRLTLEAEGPDWMVPSKMRRYRDTYEFKSKDEILAVSQVFNDAGLWETFMRGTMTRFDETSSKTSVTPFLMFEGNAAEAIEHYKVVFPDAKIEKMTEYNAGEDGKEGSIKLAIISIAGQRVMFTDSPIQHDFELTPSFSFFVECKSEAQLGERFEKLSKGGKVMMPIGEYGFSKQFGWVSDRFGVSWQLILEPEIE